MKYKCEHISNGIIVLDDNVLSLSAYEDWANSTGVFGTREQCFDCWNKDMEKK